MNWHRLLTSLIPLWPAVLVWLVICFPMLAWSSFNLRRSEWLELPLFLRMMLWFVEHAPIYRKIAKIGQAFALMDDETREQRRRHRCPVCRAERSDLVTHMLDWHFPGEWEEQERLWWTPPATTDVGVLEAWLANRGTEPDVDYDESNAEKVLNANWCKPGTCDRGCEGFCDKAFDALVALQSDAD